MLRKSYSPMQINSIILAKKMVTFTATYDFLLKTILMIAPYFPFMCTYTHVHTQGG